MSFIKILWHLSTILLLLYRSPTFQPHQPIWSFLSTCCFKLLCSSHRCQKYHSSSLTQIFQKPLINVMKSLMMKTELRVCQTHTHILSALHTHTHSAQTWEASERNSVPIDTESVIRLLGKPINFFWLSDFWIWFLIFVTWILMNM